MNKKSNCCQSNFTAKGNTTKHYVCDKCEKACDIVEEKTWEIKFDERWRERGMLCSAKT